MVVKSTAPGRAHYPALDGMRGLAILLVVVYHNFNFINYTFFGWLGVDLFFVLSGFLITDILLTSRNNKNYLRNFYVRRFLRIFPLYYAALILLLLILPPILNQPEVFDYFVTNQIWLWAFLQNWLYIFKQPAGVGVLNHFWSLAVEEQFYLLWPFAILLLKKPKRLFIFISLLLLAVLGLRLYIWLQQIENLAYANLYTFSRIDGICVGCMIALIQRLNPEFLSRNTAWIVVTFAGLNFLFDFVNQFYQFSFPFLALVGYTTFAMIFGLMVHEGTLKKKGWVNLIFTNPVLKFFGKISFGLYVIHWPVYILLNPVILKWWGGFRYANFISSVSVTILAIGLSLVSYYFFEIKFLKLKDRFAN
jgi:peptidoglycan/LPS O-acetylase OafA/YrhL